MPCSCASSSYSFSSSCWSSTSFLLPPPPFHPLLFLLLLPPSPLKIAIVVVVLVIVIIILSSDLIMFIFLARVLSLALTPHIINHHHWHIPIFQWSQHRFIRFYLVARYVITHFYQNGAKILGLWYQFEFSIGFGIRNLLASYAFTCLGVRREQVCVCVCGVCVIVVVVWLLSLFDLFLVLVFLI